MWMSKPKRFPTPDPPSAPLYNLQPLWGHQTPLDPPQNNFYPLSPPKTHTTNTDLTCSWSHNRRRAIAQFAEGITPSPSPTTSLSFAVLDLCTRPSPSLLICPLSSFPEMEPLLVTCSTFTAISSFPPCSQKTCKDLFSLPAFLPLPASIFTDVALKWLCHRPEKGKTAFSMSGSQQYKHGSVDVKQHGE